MHAARPPVLSVLIIFKKYYPLVTIGVISDRYITASVSVNGICKNSGTEYAAHGHLTTRTVRINIKSQTTICFLTTARLTYRIEYNEKYV